MDNKEKNFEKIYDQYIDKIYRFIYIKVSSEEIAQDLCSETFLRCLEVLKRNQQKIENIQAFLYRIARNLVIYHYKEKAKVQFVSLDSVPIIDPRTDLEEETSISSDIDTIKLAMLNLKQSYQDVIVCYYIDDLSIPEIAKLLNKSQVSVRVTLHRALKSLKTDMKRREV